MATSAWSASVSGTTGVLVSEWSEPVTAKTAPLPGLHFAPDDVVHAHAADSSSLSSNVASLIPNDTLHRHAADGSLLSGITQGKPGVPRPTSPISGRSTVTMMVREGGDIRLRPHDSGRVKLGIRTLGEITMYARAR